MSTPVLPGRPSLAELYEGVSQSEDPELALLRLTLDGAGRREPELPGLARVAAIPRRFDLEIIARLRGESSPSEETERLLRALVALPLVRSRRDGAWSVTDTVRDVLLSQWRATAEARSEFDRHNVTLFQLYREQLERVVEEERTLGMVSSLLRRVSPERYGLLVSHIESRQIARLLEALYHQTLRSPREGFDFFSRSFQSHESDGRMAVCESLLAAMRDFLERLPGQEELAPLKLWLRYYEARLAARIGEHRPARLILEELRARSLDDRKLQLWVLSELGGLYQSTCHYRAARKIQEEELEVATATRADPYNIPTSLLRLAGLHRALSNLERATRLLRDAIRSALAEGRSEIELSARVELSRVLHERGDVTGARTEALRALDHARRDPLQLRHMQDTVADLFMALQAHDEPALVDTLQQERLGLVAAIAEEGAEASLYLEYANHLRAGGQLRRATAVIEGPASPAGAAGRNTEALYLLRLALTYEELGRMDEAAAIYGRLVAAARRHPAERFNAAAALSNRATIYRDRNDLPAALTDSTVARKRWRRMGMAKLAAVMDVVIADTLMAAARRRLLADPADPEPADAPPVRHAGDSAPGHSRQEAARPDQSATARRAGDSAPERNRQEAARPEPSATEAAEAAAELVVETAAWAEAERALTDALGRAQAARRTPAAARLLGRLAAVAGAQARWDEAASRALEAAGAWRGVPPGHRDAGPSPRLPAEALAAVRARLDAAQRHVDFEVPPFQGDLHQVRARYRAARGESERAYALLLLAARQPEAVSDRNALAGIHLELARAAGVLGRADSAALHAEAAAGIWQRLAANDAGQPAESSLRADSENERGLRALTADVSPRAGVVRAARDLFLAASQRLADNWWYALNLSYASAAAGEWGEAAEALEEALRHGPAWLKGSVLSLRLATYRIEQALLSARSDSPEMAGRALAAAAELLESCDVSDPGLARDLPGYWRQLGDGFNLIDRLDDAAGCYQRALTIAESAGAAATSQAELHARLALLRARCGRTAAAATRFRLGAELLRGTDVEAPWEKLATALHPLIRSAEDYDAFAEVLRYLSRDQSVEAAVRRQVVRARLELNRTCFQVTHQPAIAAAAAAGAAAPAVETARPVVTPTALHGHPGLFPAGESWADGHPLFTEYIPAMRERVAAELGVRLPGIRVRPDEDLPPGSYQILLDEVPVANGTVEAGGRYCPDVAYQEHAAALTGTAAKDPRAGEPDGVWLDAAGRAAAAAAGVETWDHHEYLVRHLEQLQREHIGLYVGLQELDALLSEWQAGHQGEALRAAEQLVAAALPDLGARLRYLQVLHRLLAEGVGVGDQAAILRAFAASTRDYDGVRATVEAVRASPAAQLPGNRQVQTVLRCSPELEARLEAAYVARGRTRTLVLHPEAIRALLERIRTAVGTREQRRVGIITSSNELRPLVRVIAEVEFPHVHVLSATELSPALRDRMDGMIDAEPAS